MRLDYEVSQRAATVFGRFRTLAGLTDEEFSELIGRAIPPSTLSRLLTTETRFTNEQILSLASHVAEVLPCDLARLMKFIHTGHDCPRLVRELICARVFPLKHNELDELSAILAAAEGGASQCQVFRRFPSPGMLTDRVMPKIYRSLARSLGGRVEHRFDLIRQAARQRHFRFLQGVGAKPYCTDIFMSREHMEELLFRELPAIGCTRDELDELIEHWIDCIRIRPVRLGIYDSGKASNGLDGYFCRHDAIMLVDARFSLRRLTDMPGLLWIENKEGDVAKVLEKDRAMFEAARCATPYDLADKAAAERTLGTLLSRRTWLDRANDAFRYRSPSLN